jgi:hypothetical protein
MNKDRFLFTVEIYDNETKEKIVYEAFNTSGLTPIVLKLNEIINKVTKLNINQMMQRGKNLGGDKK